MPSERVPPRLRPKFRNGSVRVPNHGWERNRNMKRLSAFIITVCGLFAVAANSQAGILWQYDFSPSSPKVISDSGKNEITLNNQPLFSPEGTSKVVATNLSIKTPVDGSSDFFTNQNYSVKMFIKDVASGEFATLIFSGDLNGPITPGSAVIANTFDVANQTQIVELGDNIYTVTINEYTSPPPPGGTSPGAIGGIVTITPKGGEEPHDTPEPSTMLLAGFGLAGFGLNAWRKRRQR